MYIVKNGNFYSVHSDYGDALLTYLFMTAVTWAVNLTLVLIILAIKVSFHIAVLAARLSFRLVSGVVHLVVKPSEQARLVDVIEHRVQIEQGQGQGETYRWGD